MNGDRVDQLGVTAGLLFGLVGLVGDRRHRWVRVAGKIPSALLGKLSAANDTGEILHSLELVSVDIGAKRRCQDGGHHLAVRW